VGHTATAMDQTNAVAVLNTSVGAAKTVGKEECKQDTSRRDRKEPTGEWEREDVQNLSP